MQLFSEKWWEKIRWGTPTSVALHLLVIALLLIQLPKETPKPQGEQSINVELVSPPQPKQQEKPKQEAQPKKEQPKPQPAPSRQQPQAFESAAAKIKQEAKAAQLPPTAKAEKKDVVNQPKKAEAADAATKKVEKEEAQAQKQPETEKPTPQQLAVLSTPANGDNSAAEKKPAAEADEKKPAAEADAEKAVSKADSVPVRKPADDKEKSDETEGEAEATAKLPSDRFVKAEELFSAKSIADPRVKQAMGQLPVKKRILQLCNIEALEQIRHQRPDDFPDILVPFGPSGGFIGKEQIDASGGAYRSKGNWYDVDFKCKVDLETVEVTSFSFAIGNIVPKTAWKSRRLPPN
ncbi:UNVERIFIED_ORG: DNA polymerase III gamma/tau subunit [Ensifer adhaerens]|nr:DNA polymerase III gamma/tau subunit [Ensifer adhaerens]